MAIPVGDKESSFVYPQNFNDNHEYMNNIYIVNNHLYNLGKGRKLPFSGGLFCFVFRKSQRVWFGTTSENDQIEGYILTLLIQTDFSK